MNIEIEIERCKSISSNRFSKMNVLLYRLLKEVIPPNTENEVQKE